jgi:uncharacterized protein YjiS (DUF1127 family)
VKQMKQKRLADEVGLPHEADRLHRMEMKVYHRSRETTRGFFSPRTQTLRLRSRHSGTFLGDTFSMAKSSTPYRSAAALFLFADLMHAAARRVRLIARWLDAWLGKRRVAIRALYDLGAMSERELLDIGLTRVDINRVAWVASDRPQERW